MCHRDRGAAKSRAGSKDCASCHRAAPRPLTRVRVTREAEPGLAPGYEKAMHGLCLGCHREEEKDVLVSERYLSRCTTCHRHEFASDAEMRRGAPFALVATAGEDPAPGGAAGLGGAP